MTCSCLVHGLLMTEPTAYTIQHTAYTLQHTPRIVVLAKTTTYSGLVHNLFMTESTEYTIQHTLDLFMTFSWLVHDLFMTCSWFVHDLFRPCSWLVDDGTYCIHHTAYTLQHTPRIVVLAKATTCSGLVHNLRFGCWDISNTVLGKSRRFSC